jgi:phenylacetic acid degradation operon negative regulatory protein
VLAEAESLGISDLVALAATDELEVGGERDPKVLARRLWPVDEIEGRYSTFVERYRELPGALAAMRRERRKLADAEFLPGALAMAVGFQDCFASDPLLPPELLPRPWPGRTARDLVAESRRLALGIRQSSGRPALFRLFDQAIDSVPLELDRRGGAGSDETGRVPLVERISDSDPGELAEVAIVAPDAVDTVLVHESHDVRV